MKIKPSDSTSTVRAPQSAPAAKTPAPVETNGWQAKTPARAVAQPATPPTDATVKQAVTQLATAAVSQALIDQKPAHPMLEKFGKDLGLGLGVLVTEALALVPSWNTKVVDANGKPVASVEGAERIGNHDILKRHQEVVGPQIAALVDKMHPGALRDLLDGLAKGATAAPGTSYRLEAELSDRLHGR